MRIRWFGLLFALGAVASGCTSEASTPIDLDRSTTTSPPVTGLPELPDDDPNADSRELVIELAKEECRKDPTREFGVVVIADPDGVEVNRYEYPCADLEADENTGNTGASGDE